MQKITPCLWFNDNAEEAMNYYTSIFPDSKVVETSYYPEGGPGPAGRLLTAIIELKGERIQLLNGGVDFPFSEAVSLSVSVETQAEVDHLWDKLTANGGEPGQCAWLKDKFGFSWQIVPRALVELLGDPDPAKSRATMQAMLKMSKIDIATLREAHDAA